MPNRIRNPARQPQLFPVELADAGLVESTLYPRCSLGKTAPDQPFGDNRRRPWPVALDYPYVQIQPDNATAALDFDLDDPHAGAALAAHVRCFGAPAPNWIAEDRGSGRAHAVYCLASPIPRDASAAAADYLRDVRGRLRWMLRGDPRQRAHGLTRNPLHDAWRTTRFTPVPYSLDELSEWTAQLPRGERLDAPLESTPTDGSYGGPPGLFDAALRWAGRLANADADIERAYLELAARFDAAPTAHEVAVAVRGLERYRRQWAANGWHSRRFRDRQSARGERGGRRSGEARRARTVERDARIRAAGEAGIRAVEIAQLEGLSRSQVFRILARR